MDIIKSFLKKFKQDIEDEIVVTTPNASGSVHLNLPRNVNELSMSDD